MRSGSEQSWSRALGLTESSKGERGYPKGAGPLGKVGCVVEVIPL